MATAPPAESAGETDPHALSRRLATILAFIAGYVDTLGFVALFGLFTAHVTGNFVLIGAELVGPGHGVVIKLAAFPAFIVGVALTKLVMSLHARRETSPERSVYVMQTSFLVLFMVAGLFARPIHDPDSANAIVCGLFGAIAMGVQNAQSRLLLTTQAPTTVMTGNVTQAVIDAIEIMTSRDVRAKDAARTRFNKAILPVCGFGVGAITGAVSYTNGSFWALLLPIGLLVLLALRARTGACAVGE